MAGDAARNIFDSCGGMDNLSGRGGDDVFVGGAEGDYLDRRTGQQRRQLLSVAGRRVGGPCHQYRERAATPTAMCSSACSDTQPAPTSMTSCWETKDRIILVGMGGAGLHWRPGR